MKSLTIKVTNERIWTVETSDGKRAQSSTLAGALNNLWSARWPEERPPDPADWNSLSSILESIHDSGSDGNIGRGRASSG